MKKVYFVGAGPGDPELITVRGRKLLKQADVVIYAGSLVNPELLDYTEDAEIHNSAEMDLESIMTEIETAVNQDKLVVRLHTGDPGVYGALQEQLDLLYERNIECEIIPGVSSFQAASAALKREYTLPEVSQTLILTRMEGRTPVPDKEKLRYLSRHNTSMVIFLSVHMIADVVEELKKEYPAQTPAAVVQKASWPEEKTVVGNLNNIADRTENSDIESTALILVGDFLAEGDYAFSKLYDSEFSHSFRESETGGETGGSETS